MVGSILATIFIGMEIASCACACVRVRRANESTVLPFWQPIRSSETKCLYGIVSATITTTREDSPPLAKMVCKY